MLPAISLRIYLSVRLPQHTLHANFLTLIFHKVVQRRVSGIVGSLMTTLWQTVSERTLKIGQYLVKLRQKLSGVHYLTQGVPMQKFAWVDPKTLKTSVKWNFTLNPDLTSPLALSLYLKVN